MSDFKAPHGARTIEYVDMHTAGEPVRIINSGLGPLLGASILRKRRHALSDFDHIRKSAMLEPRGHSEMYGVVLCEPSDPQADIAALFMHNSGYSTMCGHATIALGRYVLEQGLVNAQGGENSFTLECPCGLIIIYAWMEEGRVISVAFDSVKGFATAFGASVIVEGLGRIEYDLGYGGAFYAILKASSIDLDLLETPIDQLRAVAIKITEAIRTTKTITHPFGSDLAFGNDLAFSDDLNFLYGTILTDDAVPGDGQLSRNLCIFGEGQIDRSPTGSGVTARMAIEVARGHLSAGDSMSFVGYSGFPFEAEVMSHGADGTIVRVKGQAYYSGSGTLLVEPGDVFGQGFGLVKRLIDQ
jgi:proline racemase